MTVGIAVEQKAVAEVDRRSMGPVWTVHGIAFGCYRACGKSEKDHGQYAHQPQEALVITRRHGMPSAYPKVTAQVVWLLMVSEPDGSFPERFEEGHGHLQVPASHSHIDVGFCDAMKIASTGW